VLNTLLFIGSYAIWRRVFLLRTTWHKNWNYKNKKLHFLT